MADVVDVTPGLLEEIEKDFKKQLKENKLIQQLLEKINQGKATYKEANEYAIELGEILAHAYKKNLNSNVLPDGKMYYNIAKRIIEPTMTNNYDLITNVTNQVQEILNKDAKIGIKPITPEINHDRIDGIINRVSYEDNFDDVAWILDEPIVNYSQSIVDDAIKVNAEFHAKSGMKPKIVRRIAGNCCDWCREVSGTYSYPDVPKEVYRRHQRCRCTVDYYPGNGKVQNVHTKKWQTQDERDKIELRKISALIAEDDLIIRNIRTNIIPKQIIDNIIPRQDIHRVGTQMYIQRKKDLHNIGQYGPSYITITNDEVLNLVKKYSGKGQIKYNRH